MSVGPSTMEMNKRYDRGIANLIQEQMSVFENGPTSTTAYDIARLYGHRGEPRTSIGWYGKALELDRKDHLLPDGELKWAGIVVKSTSISDSV